MYWKSTCVWTLACCLMCVVVIGAEEEVGSNKQANRWEDDIRRFENWDSKNSFAKDAVLFVGSSSIRMWRTRDCFDGMPVINRGFGGSQISDVNTFFHRIVAAYKPRVIVLYAGDNDVAAGKTPQRVFVDYRKFVALVHEHLAGTPVVFIGIKPSGRRWEMRSDMAEANQMIRRYARKHSDLFYFNSAGPLLNDEGRPDDSLFLADRLHLNDNGYAAWTESLRPIIESAMRGMER